MEILTNISQKGYLDLNKYEIRNAQIQNLGSNPSSPVEGQVYWNSSSHKLFLYNGTTWIEFYPTTTTLNNITAPTGDVSLNNNKITSLATPISGTDAATKAYVDGVSAGLSWKQAVRAATTANVTLSTALENGDTLDGVTLATGDRILVKDQSTGSQNGIYVVAASGSPTRATDADSGAELVNAAVFVSEGTANADTGWVCTTNATITVGSTSLTFVQFSGGTGYSGGDAIDITANTISVLYDGTTIQTNGSNELEVVPGYFGRKFVDTISGDGSTDSFNIVHNFASKDVTVSVRGTSSPYTDLQVFTDVTFTDNNTVTIGFATAPGSGVNFSVVVIG